MRESVLAVVFAAMVPVWAGCSPTLAPRELLDARAAYAEAANGAAAQHSPADLEVARQALNRAEAAFAKDPESDETRDLAYIAGVKARTAETRGRFTANEKARLAADEQFRATVHHKLDAKNAALASEIQRTQATGQALVMEQQRRADAEQRRAEMEKRLREATDRLSALAQVKEEPRGLVITLSGSVLFASDKSDLLPTATSRLDEVANALAEAPDRRVTIYGFTDSRGDASYNQQLSERRASSVRSYLVSKGVDASRITAVGKGPNEPVADNATAEGRANNRRVEIVLAPSESTGAEDLYSH